MFEIVAGVIGAGVGFALIFVGAKRRADDERQAAKAQADAIRVRGKAEAEGVKRSAESEAREEALAARMKGEEDVAERLAALARREERIDRRLNELPSEAATIQERQRAAQEREQARRALDDRARQAQRDASVTLGRLKGTLEQAAGATGQQLAAELVDGWLESTRAESAQRLRLIDANTQDPEYTREAKRVMGIAVGRYHGHYLTERLLTNLPILKSTADKLIAADSLVLRAIEEGANIKLTLHETGEGVRLEGQDSVGREIARRVIRKIEKNAARELDKDPPKFVAGVKEHLDREIVDLGRKAFQELEIPRAHPEIVKLVGMLNYRTSYTQNQWKHALEASLLAGMIAAEMNLDVKLARRATLMHDIGKALTHAIDGSHAVIGADIARKLGEAEIVANAIGAHHGEEPCNSVYAHLVAACDAMSGGRPGARREQTDNYVTKLADLERIGGNFRGVDRAFAVQGGREVRVYVRETDVTDLRAVELSAEIAKQISDEMTFPGQIKVTVIRQVQSVAIAN